MGPAETGRAAPQGERSLDRFGDTAGRTCGGDRTQVEAAVAGFGGPYHRQPREGFVERELDVGVATPSLALVVEAGQEAVDQPHLQYRCLKFAGADDVVDGGGLAQELGDLLPFVTPEIRAYAAA